GGEANGAGARRGSRENGHGGGGDVIGTMVFAEPVEIEAQLVSQFNLFEQVAQAFCRRLQVAAVQRVRGIFSERIKSEFHGGSPWPEMWAWVPERSRTHMGVTAAARAVPPMAERP